ncbi:unnamed protein product [Pylaiella littoralis]
MYRFLSYALLLPLLLYDIRIVSSVCCRDEIRCCACMGVMIPSIMGARQQPPTPFDIHLVQQPGITVTDRSDHQQEGRSTNIIHVARPRSMRGTAAASTLLLAFCGMQGGMLARAAEEAGSCSVDAAGGGSCQTPVVTERASAEAVPAGGIFGRLFSFFSRESEEEETCLPQDPKANAVSRKKQLAAKQKNYTWRMGGTPIDMPFLDGFPPKDELPSITWTGKLVASLVRITLGSTRGTIGVGEIIEALSDPVRAKNFGPRLKRIITDAKGQERPVDISDFEDLHAFPIKTPDSMADFDDNDAFARQRLQGANCVVIEKCSAATREKLVILDTDPAYKGLKDKVDSLMEAGKLFVVDHDMLKGLESSPLDGIVRYLAPSVALFEAVDDELLPLKPIGIQLSQGEAATPIFTPEDGYNWKIAKACFEAADFIIHEAVSHLSYTHVVLEAPMVSMNRQLPEEHPIHALFAPHVEGTAFINWGAHELLMPVDEAVDRLLANKIEDAWTLVREKANECCSTLERMSKDFSPETDLASRGMTTADFPGRYPYRDVGLKYWDATHTWVKEYLNVYYSTEDDVTGDYELQAFVDEVVNIGELRWLEEWKDSKDKLGLLAKVVLASLIYSASTLHAAVNFPQKPLMSYAPNNPGSVYMPPPTDKAKRGFEDYLAYLPPLEVATEQVVALSLLGSVFHTKLGAYEANHFSDTRVLAALARFQQAIEEIEIDIVDENAYVVSTWRTRGKDKKDAANFGYTTLLPDNIPQSINI